MPTSGDSLAKQVQTSYLKLSLVAADLNAASDELGKSISEIDAALKKLNLGITVWVDVNDYHCETEHAYFKEQIGYSKIDGKWGVALRTVDGDLQWPQNDKIEQWLFNDGPRRLRLAAIAHVPALLNELSEEAVTTSQKIADRLAEVKEVAEVVKQAAAETNPRPSSRLNIRVTNVEVRK